MLRSHITPTRQRRLKRALHALNQVSVDVALAVLLGLLMGGPAVLMVIFKP